ncbi:hypothetical protein BV898_05808 [Hypsibius exemplaris]|uniref:Uncharacterized protein n=1 Tax=Hypsibius exemplaris TaxID=2072580 RepID=A0A1W0WYH1_HYPEX|nr:hypothetical protein BV898_05808 [Hypsibius exemplaris]
MCGRCRKQRASSINERVVPNFWKTFLMQTGQLCSQHPHANFSGLKRPDSLTNYTKTGQPFQRYVKAQQELSEGLVRKILKGQANVLEEHNIGVQGKAVVVPLVADDGTASGGRW